MVVWPNEKKFAFTVFDDTDLATIDNVKEVYFLLSKCGFRTTKSVWPVKGHRKYYIGGSTLEDEEYLKWVLCLKRTGFEIAFHNATYHSSTREETIYGLEKFHEIFNEYPSSYANHADCEESVYWAENRLTGIYRIVYKILTRNRNKKYFCGHLEDSRFFWGDVCKEKIKYVRNFVFSDINTLKVCPFMPYHDEKRPYVNYWFCSSEGANVNIFNNCVSEQNQDKLEESAGACIMYTHFANNFFVDGKINSRFKFLMERLSKKEGWFVPVTELLDYLLKVNGHHDITAKERSRLERLWLLHKIKVGTT